ncbi:hypothetical protein T08_16151 [Trichinella sp. T8]|nr:hypothetical protein T08_15255 [Trichinella sp. T8]KRZ81916.1 hypothetical protein T08_13840 [Trichinella sp. T8]KRZ93793.1 hypothetical protein T08_16151 [Trichinella sp. T8]
MGIVHWLGGTEILMDDVRCAGGNTTLNDSKRDFRSVSQLKFVDGGVVDGVSTLIMRWKCAEQVYNNE